MKREWFLKRNCSISPRQLGLAYAVLCAGSFGIAFIFVLQGIWIVLAFALVEMAAFALALLHYARHATDHEHIALSERCLLVERVAGGHTEQVRLDPCWTRIAVPDLHHHTLIQLKSGAITVEVGSFVTDAIRQQVALELRRALRTSSFLR